MHKLMILTLLAASNIHGCRNKSKTPTIPESKGTANNPVQAEKPLSPDSETAGFKRNAEQTVKQLLDTSVEPFQEDMDAHGNLNITPDHYGNNTKVAKKSKGRRFYQLAISEWKNRNWQKARNHYLTACQFGYARGCHRYGWHQQGIGNLTNAVRFYRFACKKGIAKSCNNMGWIAEKIKSFEQARNFYSMACMSKSRNGCANLTRIQEKNKAKNPAHQTAH